MDEDHRKLGGALQHLFTDRVEELNAEVGFVRRRRRGMSAPDWVRLLAFGWIARPRSAFAALAQRARVSAQALQQRLTGRAVALFQALLNDALTRAFTARRPLIPLLARFPGIQVHDSTQVPLPPALADRYPACGGLDGRRGAAGWKLLIRFDVLGGGLLPFELLPGKTLDRAAAAEPLAGLTAGMLYLADLGFFHLGRLREVTRRGAHYITRLPARVDVTGADGVPRLVGLWLRGRSEAVIDRELRVGQEGLTARVVALRVPQEAAAGRRRKLRAKNRKRGRPVSANQLALCDWWVGATDLPAAELLSEEVRTLYGLRWQVELLFKHWKQAGGLGAVQGRTAASVQVEYLAKLLGVVVTHWQALLGGGPLEGRNRQAVHRLVCDACRRLETALAAGAPEAALAEIMAGLAAGLRRLPRRPRRKRAATTRQRMFGKRDAA